MEQQLGTPLQYLYASKDYRTMRIKNSDFLENKYRFAVLLPTLTFTKKPSKYNHVFNKDYFSH